MADITSNATIQPVDKVLQMNLEIPDYQRPYKWTRKNVSDLLSDIGTAIDESHRPNYDNFKYRVGTVILYRTKNKKGEEIYEVVDGQQRLITLSLIKYALDSDFSNNILNREFSDSTSQNNIFDNYKFIREWADINGRLIKDYQDALNKVLEIVVLVVEEMSEAFQLFDSQNTRGKELDPHDLLKAYHLREINDYHFEKLNLIRRWEDIHPKSIRELFSLYLYPILNWSRKEKSKIFTVQDIDEYKGVNFGCTYTYAQRVFKSMPCFQIDQPFSAGRDFFLMVEHYINLLNYLKDIFFSGNSNDDRYGKIKEILKGNDEETYSSTGFSYAINLFYCAMLFYYDRFHMLDEMAVKKMFVWAMMIRVDMKSLGLDTINNYAIGGNVDKDRYTNHVAMFFKIATARSNSEIANLRIDVLRKSDAAKSDKWKNLYKELKNLMGVKDGNK